MGQSCLSYCFTPKYTHTYSKKESNKPTHFLFCQHCSMCLLQVNLYSNLTGELSLTHIRNNWSSHPLSARQLSASNTDMWILGERKFQQTPMSDQGQMVSCKFKAEIPGPSCFVAVCAAWAEAGIDTIHHECKWATWFDISNKPVSMYQWV